ncbi:hypothetical protein K505DRAFT_249813 [Melanomma pulvis-pyrius CBS 109.77]|uniref:Putative gamma-glutamylcyclotransferase n=1 Tax=Melanomma pulvis-pyrius CBS 109.77 TaxID=1314802 RepID=A0A6A6X496_9PLEO|nr:hypothetical protein K505DRAFT_249813 [Melanomma pulvis-pyrius CBS 109.77]
MSHTAFFYGTLMAPPVLHRVIWGPSPPSTSVQKSLLTIRPAILHRFQRHKVKHADYPAILPANMSTSVRGTLVTGLTDGDIWRLDIFEGREYERRKVSVRLLQQTPRSAGVDAAIGDVSQAEEENIEGDEVEAEVYVWIAGKQRLEPEEWDFDHFVKEKMARWVGREPGEMDDGFHVLDVDDAVAAQKDPTGGRGLNGSITRELEKGAEEEVVRSAV